MYTRAPSVHHSLQMSFMPRNSITYYILHITFVPLSINYALGLVNNINLSLHGKLFSYVTKMLATTNQQQTLLFHPELSKKLKCLTL